MLDKLTEAERRAYILMERIRPPEALGLLMRRGRVVSESIVSELGIYGIFLQKGEEIVINEDHGYLLRSKAATSNEGGVATGYAHLDSVILV